MTKKIIVRKSDIYGVEMNSSRKKRWFNGYIQCEVLVYMKHLPKPCRFTFGDDDELGQAFFARLKAELNHEHVSEMIDIDDIIGHIKNMVS